MTAGLFFVATLALPFACGLPLLRLPSLAGLPLTARAAIGWAGGTAVLAALLTVLSAMAVPWWLWVVCTIALVPVAVASRMRSPQRPHGHVNSPIRRSWTVAAVTCAAVIAGAGLVQFAAGAATSADLSYFWGVKAVHFSLERGVDFQWMQQPFLAHLHPNYPPLWPVILAWGALVAGSMPWTVVPVFTWIFLAATAVIIHALLRQKLGPGGATAVTCLWFAVLTGSAVKSFSGGSAEGPLLLFVTVAVTALVVENPGEPPKLRWFAAAALAAAVLTKSEGSVAAMLIVAGTLVRDFTWRRPGAIRNTLRLALPALVAAGLWTTIKIAHGLPLLDPIRETALHISFDHLEVIFKVCAQLLCAGGLWVGWLAPLIAVSMRRPAQPQRILPGLLFAGGLPVFAAFYYLHATGNPVELIVWTFPRLIQPAISAWIVCLGVLSLGDPVGVAPTAHRSRGDG